MVSKSTAFLLKVLILVSLVPGSLYGQAPAILQLKRSLQRPQSDSSRVLTFIELGRNYIQLDLDSSWHYLDQAIKLGQSFSDKRMLIKAYNVLATTYVVTGEHTKGLSILQKAEQLSLHYPFDTLQVELQTRKIQTYRIQGNYQQSLRLGLKLERSIEKRPALQTASVITLYTELAIIYQQLHNDSLALTFYEKANEYALSHQKKRSLIGTLGNLGEYYLTRNEFTKGEYYTQKSLRISRELGFNHSTAESLRNLGEIKRNQHHYTEAIAYYKQALAIHQQIGAKEFIGYIYLHLSQSYMGQQEFAKALVYVEKSIQVFRSIQSAYYLHKALVVKVDLLQQTGQFKAALRFMQQAQSLNDSLTGLDKQKAIAQIQARFDLERKQNQIINLKRDSTLQQQARQTIQLQLTLTQHQLTFYTTISILFFLLAIVLCLTYIKQKKAQRLLSLQKKEILLQTDQLIEINKTKDRLFSIISHDIRSPLVGIKQDVRQLIHDAHSGNQTALPLLTRLERKTDNLLALLMTMLDWAYVQFKGFQTNLQAINLGDQVTQAISYFSDRANQKQITVLNQVNDDRLVVADAQLLAIVMRNLLDNAIKFTPVGGYIRLLTIEHPDTNSIELQIRDTGAGMTKEICDNLFTQPEVRRGTQDELGTGLGIQISQELVVKQHGKLSIESQLHKGTTVKILLPAPPDLP